MLIYEKKNRNILLKQTLFAEIMPCSKLKKIKSMTLKICGHHFVTKYKISLILCTSFLYL